MSVPLRLILIALVLVAGCAPGAASPDPADPVTGGSTIDDTATTQTTRDPQRVYFETMPPGQVLTDEEECAEQILAEPSLEVRRDNAEANETTVEVEVDIDGADGFWGEVFAPRISGDFTGTTEQILRWGACKWGFDEDLTFARAVTESSWRMSTAGDRSTDEAECALIELDAPCAQSYGLLQVKGTVHEGTFPASQQSAAFGVDYAMAWLRACYEGSFTWLDEQGYEPGDELGCVGAWFSGGWFDPGAEDYLSEVGSHLDARTWESYRS